MKIDFAAFLDSLQYMGYGLLGIFGIIAILVLMVKALQILFPPKSNR